MRLSSGVGVFGAVLLALAGGCAGREAAWEADGQAQQMSQPAAGPEGGAAAAPGGEATAAPAGDDAETAWAARLDEAKVREAIAAWEKRLGPNGTDAEVLTKLARAYYFLADGHLSLQDGKADEVLDTFTKGVDYAERALVNTSPPFAEKMRDGAKIEEAIGLVDKAGLAPMYWYAVNLGKFATAKGFTTRLFYKDRIFAIMKHVLDLDRTYFHAAPHRYFGAFYAIAPSFAGGDLEKSKKHFEESIKLAPDYLATRVLYAQYYAPKAQDPELFKQQLQYVLDADPKKLPDVEPENTIEKEKAKRLLAQQDELF